MRTLGLQLAAATIALATLRAQARTADAQVLGCPKLGYSLAVPTGWHIRGGCSPKAGATDGQGIALTVAVERHAWWDDARSRASIRGDVAARWPSATAGPVFYAQYIGGRRYQVGIAVARDRAGAGVRYAEMETFATGRLYKFAAESAVGPDRIRTIDTIWATISIAAPAAAAVATSPDAPGVVVSATPLKVDHGGAFPPPASQQYVVARITVANRSQSSYDVDPLAFSVVDSGDGIAHTAELLDPNIVRTALRATTLGPGRTASGDVAFQIPAGESSAALYWQPSPASQQVPVPTGG
jgi:hypothetical protein